MPRLASAFINTTVQSPLSTSQVSWLVPSAVTWATQKDWSPGGVGVASPGTRRYVMRSGDRSKSRITSRFTPSR